MTARIPRFSLRVGFVTATCSFLLVFASAGTPIPLYTTFRQQDGLADGDFALASVGYFAAAVTSLLVFGRLSNHLGRRAVGVLALLSAIGGSMLLSQVHGFPPLLGARVLQGLAAGIAPSALGAYVIDSAPERPAWLPHVITASTPMVGIPLGALLSGVLVDHTAQPRLLVAAIMSAALVVCAVLLLLSPETMPRARGVLASLKPRLQVPGGRGRVLVAAGAAAIATWSLGGFFQAFGPSVTAQYLGTADALAAAAVFSAVMILNPVGGPLVSRLSAPVGVRIGMGAYLIALTGIISALFLGTIGPFIGASLVVGIAQGIASTSAIRALISGIQPAERAGLLATIYLVSYCGAAVPGLVAGRLTNVLDVAQIAVGYALLGTAAATVAMITIRDPLRRLPDERWP